MRIHQRTILGLLCLATTLATALASPVYAQEDIPPPFMLTNPEPGKPVWTSLLKLRDAEDMYRDSDWWYTYADIASQTEATMGNHRTALHMRDAAETPRDSVATLPDGVTARNALDVIASIADTARVIMINERHHAASDRLLTLQLLPILYEKGYRYLAAEAFSFLDETLNSRTYPVQGLTGNYTNETVFAEVVREALRLGFTLVPYEYNHNDYSDDNELNRQQFRDWQQATHIQERIFAKDPDAKVLVHAGYAHIKENVVESWYPMAVYFRETTGINPVTIDQTVLSERSAPEFEHPIYRAAIDNGLMTDEPVFLFDADGQPMDPDRYVVDLQVLTPRTTYSGDRPDWMHLGHTRQPVDASVPECLEQTCFIEVRLPSEPENAVPLDRTQVDGQTTVRVFIPTGEPASVHVYDAEGTLLRTFEVSR